MFLIFPNLIYGILEKYGFKYSPDEVLEPGYISKDSSQNSQEGDSTPGTIVAYRVTVRQLEALIRLSEAIARNHMEKVVSKRPCVESSEIDLSNFLDNEDGAAERIPDQDAEHSAPEENGPALKNGDFYNLFIPNHNDLTNNEQGSDSRHKKKLVITEEHFQEYVTQALVMCLRQHEETTTQGGKNVWQNSQGDYNNTDEVQEEVKCIKAMIERFIQREGHLIVIDDGTRAAQLLLGMAKQDVHPARTEF
ncbi:DNA replication licensing factor MCM6 [Canna indica]|uniref:DNA helicase n=1 Tax=Canna indica TaxID=4628 RepID=A0AAQ3QMC6_9LILI|nr:DNA replication licensing factor MCM6 [Canna indica]